MQEESPEEYNIRVEEFLANNEYSNQNIIAIDRGRNLQERSAVLIENGVFQGIAFFDLNYQVNNIEILRNIITPMKNSRDAKNIILSYLKKKKVYKIISF